MASVVQPSWETRCVVVVTVERYQKTKDCHTEHRTHRRANHCVVTVKVVEGQTTAHCYTECQGHRRVSRCVGQASVRRCQMAEHWRTECQDQRRANLDRAVHHRCSTTSYYDADESGIDDGMNVANEVDRTIRCRSDSDRQTKVVAHQGTKGRTEAFEGRNQRHPSSAACHSWASSDHHPSILEESLGQETCHHLDTCCLLEMECCRRRILRHRRRTGRSLLQEMVRRTEVGVHRETGCHQKDS